MTRRFSNAVFLSGAAKAEQLPPDVGKEVAFAGRSNSGKSSLINSLCGSARLARTAKTPGRTRQINFFETAPGCRLSDLPGYGFAAVPKPLRAQWQQLLDGYFRQRLSLRGVMLAVDIRRLLMPGDWRMLQWCAGLPVCIVLTKADKLKRNAVQQALLQTQTALNNDRIPVYATSSLTGQGLDETARQLRRWLS